jgi:hypothetical protein
MKPGNDLGRAGLRLSAGSVSPWESVSELLRQVSGSHLRTCSHLGAGAAAAQTRPLTSESLGRIADSTAAFQYPATHPPRQQQRLHGSSCRLLATLRGLAVRLLPPMAAFTEWLVQTELAVRRSAP